MVKVCLMITVTLKSHKLKMLFSCSGVGGVLSVGLLTGAECCGANTAWAPAGMAFGR